ncbi:hypothetical protein JL720_14966 [Aureococcus anophagefferens]|nr:hypothetical protein JL720_14966 [Aureococcus anophagefferens]
MGKVGDLVAGAEASTNERADRVEAKVDALAHAKRPERPSGEELARLKAVQKTLVDIRRAVRRHESSDAKLDGSSRVVAIGARPAEKAKPRPRPPPKSDGPVLRALEQQVRECKKAIDALAKQEPKTVKERVVVMSDQIRNGTSHFDGRLSVVERKLKAVDEEARAKKKAAPKMAPSTITKSNTAHLDHRLHEIQKVVNETGEDVRAIKKRQKLKLPKNDSAEVLKRVEATRAALADAKQELGEKMDGLRKAYRVPRAPKPSADPELSAAVKSLADKIDALQKVNDTHGVVLQKLLNRKSKTPFKPPAAPHDTEVRRRVTNIEDTVARIERKLGRQRPRPATPLNRELEKATLAAQQLSAWMWSRVKLRLADSHAARRWALAAPADNHRGGAASSPRGRRRAQWSDYWTLEPLDALGTFRLRASDGGGYLAARPAKSKEEALPDGRAPPFDPGHVRRGDEEDAEIDRKRWLKLHAHIANRVDRRSLSFNDLKDADEFFECLAGGDDTVDADELESALRFCGMNPSRRDIDRVMLEIDQDGSGELDRDEFITLLFDAEMSQRFFDAARSGDKRSTMLTVPLWSLTSRTLEHHQRIRGTNTLKEGPKAGGDDDDDDSARSAGRRPSRAADRPRRRARSASVADRDSRRASSAARGSAVGFRVRKNTAALNAAAVVTAAVHEEEKVEAVGVVVGSAGGGKLAGTGQMVGPGAFRRAGGVRGGLS